MPTCPKVSVCIPTYNQAQYVADTIESILKQSFEDYEIVISDDCSTDATREIIDRFARGDRRIRVLENDRNLGMVPNWNRCLRDARGEFIKFVFGDDLLTGADALGRMVAALERDAGVALVSSPRTLIDADSQVIKVLCHFRGDVTLPGTRVINVCLEARKNLIGEPSAVMFRRADAGRGFLPDYRQTVDLEMWFHLLEKGSFAHVGESLCAFRIHDAQQTAQNNKSIDKLTDNFLLADGYLDKPYITLNSFSRAFVRYDNVYQIWKSHKSDLISREQAVHMIDDCYGMMAFSLMYPLYKLWKPLRKLTYRKIS